MKYRYALHTILSLSLLSTLACSPGAGPLQNTSLNAAGLSAADEALDALNSIDDSSSEFPASDEADIDDLDKSGGSGTVAYTYKGLHLSDDAVSLAMGDTLRSNANRKEGLETKKDKVRLRLTDTGQLLLRDKNNTVVWKTPDNARFVASPELHYELIFQEDSNLVLHQRFQRNTGLSHAQRAASTSLPSASSKGHLVRGKQQAVLESTTGKLQKFVSQNGVYQVYLRDNGDLQVWRVLENNAQRIWHSNKTGPKGRIYRLELRARGDLAIYSYDAKSKKQLDRHWESGGSNGDHLIIQNDGNFILSEGGNTSKIKFRTGMDEKMWRNPVAWSNNTRALWSSGTANSGADLMSLVSDLDGKPDLMLYQLGDNDEPAINWTAHKGKPKTKKNCGGIKWVKCAANSVGDFFEDLFNKGLNALRGPEPVIRELLQTVCRTTERNFRDDLISLACAAQGNSCEVLLNSPISACGLSKKGNGFFLFGTEVNFTGQPRDNVLRSTVYTHYRDAKKNDKLEFTIKMGDFYSNWQNGLNQLSGPELTFVTNTLGLSNLQNQVTNIATRIGSEGRFSVSLAFNSLTRDARLYINNHLDLNSNNVEDRLPALNTVINTFSNVYPGRLTVVYGEDEIKDTFTIKSRMNLYPLPLAEQIVFVRLFGSTYAEFTRD